MDYLFNHWQVIAVVVAVVILLLCYRWVLALCGIILIPDDSVGVMTKKFVIFGKNRRLPAGRIVALNGEAGYQADTLPPGLHLGLWPWQYQVDLVKFCTVAPVLIGNEMNSIPTLGSSINALTTPGSIDGVKPAVTSSGLP